MSVCMYSPARAFFRFFLSPDSAGGRLAAPRAGALSILFSIHSFFNSSYYQESDFISDDSVLKSFNNNNITQHDIMNT